MDTLRGLPILRTPAIRPGDNLDGRYRILDVIAEGGMSTVFLAEHALIKRRVAVKVLSPTLAADVTMVKRFMNEASAAGTLGHPHIVESTDMGFTADRIPYIVFEYLEGALLTEEIYRVKGMSVRRALRIAMQIASALDAAHAAAIVHLDLKSDNIFLVDKEATSDHVKVLDFGVARFMEVDLDKSQNLVVGTPEFMSPEQISTPELVDARSDVYALGVVLYEMLAARRPFPLEEPRILLHRIVHEPPAPLGCANIPAALERAIFDKMLAKNPHDRFSSMREAYAAFDAILRSITAADSIPPPLVTTESSASKSIEVSYLPTRDRSWPWSLLALAVMAGGAGVVLGYVMADNSEVAASMRAVEADAAQLTSRLEGKVMSTRLRAASVADTPVIRAAIETDRATIIDLFAERAPFEPAADEVFELVQGHAGVVLRLPAEATPFAAALPETTLALEAGRLRVISRVAIQSQAGEVSGSATLATPIDLAKAYQPRAIGVVEQHLVGFAQPIVLVARQPAEDTLDVSVPVATPSGVTAPQLSLHARIRKPTEPQILRVARYASFGLGALFFAGFAIVASIRSRRS